MLRKLKLGPCLLAFFSSAFLAFGLYHVHNFADITEGGVLGMTLLLQHWLNISPSISGGVLNLLCYALGWKVLGKSFVLYSLISTAGFVIPYRIYEMFPPLWPQLAQMPLLAAVLGAVFIGVGAGLCVRIGGAPGGDDALAMSIQKLTGMKIQWIYLMLDMIVMLLSLSYIPLKKIAYSILTVVLSGQIVGWVQYIPMPKNWLEDKTEP